MLCRSYQLFNCITIRSVTTSIRDLEKHVGSLADEETQISDIYKKKPLTVNLQYYPTVVLLNTLS